MGSVVPVPGTGPGCQFPELGALGWGRGLIRGHQLCGCGSFDADPAPLGCSESELRALGEEQHRTYSVVNSLWFSL